MAKGNMLLGQSSKKLGSVVFYVRNGRQAARVWTDSGARRGKDASFLARAQRVAFGGAANEWNAYKYICTRMYNRGKKPTESDYNYFTKQNWRNFPFLTKQLNEAGFQCPVPGIFSRGNLGALNLEMVFSQSEDLGSKSVIVSSDDVTSAETTPWNANMGLLKTQLQKCFPNADKVTYQLIVVRPTLVIIGNRNYRLPQFFYNTVVVSLYSELDEGEDTTNVYKYFSEHVTDSLLSTQLLTQNGPFMNFSSLFNLNLAGTEENPVEYDVLPLVFATNDAANDCYTTTLYDGMFTKSTGPFIYWQSQRTESAFREACSSYGFTADVMQTDIAQWLRGIGGNNLRYINVLAKHSPEDAAILQKAVDEMGDDALAAPMTLLRKTYGPQANAKSTKKSTQD